MKNSREIIALSPISFGTSGARGLVTDLNAEVCFAYTLAFLHSIAPSPGSRMALGMDLRPSSPAIAGACAAAIHYAGFQVDFCGILPTPALAFYALEQQIPALMITGSHIPFDRNGIKFYRPDGEISKQDEVAIGAAEVRLPDVLPDAVLPEIDPSAYQGFIDRYRQFFPPQQLAGLRLGLYEHSSVARDLLRELLQALGAEVISIERTDRFMPIDTEAVSERDTAMAKQWAARYGFDAVLSTDGDADRPLLGDQNGRWLRGDIVGILCAQYLNAQAVATPVSSNSAVEKCGDFAVLRTRIGSPYVIEGMEKLAGQGYNSVVGFEANGGFLVATEIRKQGRRLKPLPTRDAVLPMLVLLAMAKERGVKLSELPESLPARYTASDRLASFAPEKSRSLLYELAASQAAVSDLLGDLCGNVTASDQTDGLRLSFENGEIVHLRASGNAPELRCYAEADTQMRAEEIVRACLSRLADYKSSQ
ncbi:phosphomannomutase [Candidatus Methylomicrobium oryzae]|uniref:phosphomannomutase n=1 Tax=Candidatus Methylomicrobium oryzae TaxID=2802053 RepID=UPI001924A339|nr:phosphomannomutase [Methylomicrobium sp. RS1]MBL1262374.1 phosphomannomutase [Methylomicrobium sp. RS1]